MNNAMVRYQMDFIKCGATGLGIEVVWTGLCNMLNHDKTLSCRTSLIMFPIYGMAFLIRPLHSIIGKHNSLLRGSLYTMMIFTAEYLSGELLKKHDMCPWDYSENKYNINGVIRLDYAPAWFSVGLLYEKMLLCNYSTPEIIHKISGRELAH